MDNNDFLLTLVLLLKGKDLVSFSQVSKKASFAFNKNIAWKEFVCRDYGYVSEESINWKEVYRSVKTYSKWFALCYAVQEHHADLVSSILNKDGKEIGLGEKILGTAIANNDENIALCIYRHPSFKTTVSLAHVTVLAIKRGMLRLINSILDNEPDKGKRDLISLLRDVRDHKILPENIKEMSSMYFDSASGTSLSAYLVNYIEENITAYAKLLHK